ncbi:MAG TPA: Ku protein [Candidatus Limnocylindria bacterium]|nr:Ku protein [Candidatus Limnocylindria bacterium]
MPARSIGSGTISFGLVSIPVRVFVATHSEQPSFNLLHAECNSRIRQQTWCPRCERVVERSELVRGYAVGKNEYVRFTDEELKALEAAASTAIDIQEFVPLDQVDPIYFASTRYLGPDRGGEKAYQLLADAMRAMGKVALAQHVARGKEHLVLIRPFADGLAIHDLYYADEIRPFADVERGGDVKVRPAEAELARRLIDELSAPAFAPEQYHDHYRERLKEAVDRKVAGEEIASTAPPEQAPQVIDLMEALKKSLAEGRAGRGRRPTRAEGVAARPAARKRAAKK